MQSDVLNELTRILQTAISPVAMISGVGLLVLAMTNRFSHIADRARTVSRQLKSAGEAEKEPLTIQVRTLYRRLRLMMWSIGLALTGIFFISLLISALFIIYLLNIGSQNIVFVLFVMSLVSLVSSLILFISDIALSLHAIREELKDQLSG
jgi:hypothetical protein